MCCLLFVVRCALCVVIRLMFFVGCGPLIVVRGLLFVVCCACVGCLLFVFLFNLRFSFLWFVV